MSMLRLGNEMLWFLSINPFWWSEHIRALIRCFRKTDHVWTDNIINEYKEQESIASGKLRMFLNRHEATVKQNTQQWWRKFGSLRNRMTHEVSDTR